MSGLNLAKTSVLMTAKERAKAVIALQLQNMNSLSDEDWEKVKVGDSSFMMPGQSEVRMLVFGCPSEQAREYNFLMELKSHVWERILEQMRDDVNHLGLIEGRMVRAKQLFRISPVIHYAISELERLPMLVSKSDYDEVVVRTREEERQEMLALEGRYNLTEQEAFYRLIAEGKIEKGGDLDAYLDFINDFGRTKEELIAEKIAEIKKGLAEHEERKKRVGGDGGMLTNFYNKYQGLDDEQVKAKVIESYFLETPSGEEYNRWQETVKQERKRLLEAAEKGELVVKDEGILAGSYYDWKGRHQKFAGEPGAEERGWNPLHEDCMEIGYSGGKVTSAVKAGSDWKQIVAVTIHNKENMGFGGEDGGRKRLEGVIDLLRKLVFFEVDGKDFKDKERKFRLADTSYREALVVSVEAAKGVIQDIYNNVALIEAIEDKYFDGMELVNREPDKPFSIGSYIVQAQRFIEVHNADFKDYERMFNLMSIGFWDYKLEGIESYLLGLEYKADNDWVSKNLDIAGRACGE